MVLKRIGVLSVAKIVGAVYAVFGVLGGLFFMALSFLGAGIAAANEDVPPFIGMLFGVGAIIILPVLYACMGFVFGALSAALYNLFSGMVGGIEVELQQGVTAR
jgi:uncharacterized protein involved in cysteine biosynthesis